MRFLVPLLLLVPLLPAAAADAVVCQGAPFAGACAGEWEEGDCETQGYRGDGAVAGSPFAGAWVEGSAYCETHHDHAYADRGAFAGAASFLAGVAVGWYAYEETEAGAETSGCVTFVDVYALFIGWGVNVGCPAGAPQDPGWGRLLP